MSKNKKILLFNINIIKTAQIKNLCRGMDIDAVVVSGDYYGQMIGELYRDEKAPLPPSRRDDGFEAEMMVFCGLSSAELDEFLARYRSAAVPPVALKAMLTPSNALWSAARLYRELSHENELLNGKKQS